METCLIKFFVNREMSVINSASLFDDSKYLKKFSIHDSRFTIDDSFSTFSLQKAFILATSSVERSCITWYCKYFWLVLNSVKKSSLTTTSEISSHFKR